MQTTALAAVAASNSFRVRDPAALRAALEPHGALVTTCGTSRVRVSFPAGLPAPNPSLDSGEVSLVDVPALIAAQLEPGEIAVLKEIRAADGEIGATALAFDSSGATVTVDLEEIEALARELKRAPAHL